VEAAGRLTVGTPRSVETPHYHIWTDALHARRLAREADNKWDRGSYVRWTIASAWTAFETTCEHLTGASGLGIRFKERLNEALDAKGLPRPDWGAGLWQDVLGIYRLRKEYVHPGAPQTRLFAPLAEAEAAITTLRLAIKDIYARTGEAAEAWPDDDEDAVDPRKGFFAHATVIRAGVTRETGLRICYVMSGQEYEAEVTGPHEDHVALMEDLLRKIRVPVSAIRAYRGNELIDELTVKMRGSSLEGANPARTVDKTPLRT
jgi:hypothetical protein